MKLTASPSRDFSPCPGEGEYLKPQASLFFILSDLAGPSVGGCSAHAPEPPRAFLFLLEEKEAKDHLGGFPLKTPEGAGSGRAPLSPTAGECFNGFFARSAKMLCELLAILKKIGS